MSLAASKSLARTPVVVARPARRQAVARSGPVAVKAKYGDESRFFDLDDIENTAGSWDMYGVADERRYPGLQAEFFERAAAPVARREAILALLGVAGPAGILAWGAKGSKDVKLPITVGPQKPPVVGPRDRI